jgi:hypothetical protein
LVYNNNRSTKLLTTLKERLMKAIQEDRVFNTQELITLSEVFADVYNSGVMTAKQAAVAVKVEKALRGATAALLPDVQAYLEVLNK